MLRRGEGGWSWRRVRTLSSLERTDPKEKQCRSSHPQTTWCWTGLATTAAASLEASSPDARSLAPLVRLAALVVTWAHAMSYALNQVAGNEVGLVLEDMRVVLTAIASPAGTAQVVAQTGGIASVLAIPIEMTEAIVDGVDGE